MFDILDVQLFVPLGTATADHLVNLEFALGSEFQLKEIDSTGPKTLRVNIISPEAEFPSIDDLEIAIRRRAPEVQFQWQRFGGVRTGETMTVHY
ncbi:MAG: hypothetical protein Q7K26_01475 [bacterium]|nr:hypothetical protein [bacterium]